MKTSKFVIAIGACALLLLAGSPTWGAKGGIKGKPSPPTEDPDPTPIDGYYFWRLGHMDGPHDLSMALGISRDGKVAVGTTDVVEKLKAFRIDIDWAINTEDPTGVQGEAPLYNELQVQESLGSEAAFAASDKTVTDEECAYDKGFPDESTLNLDWCGSFPVGTMTTGTVSYSVEWLFAPDPEATDEDDLPYIKIPDFGGGISDMVATDVSADGTIMVGTGNVKKGLVAFLADMTTALVDPETGETVVEPVQLTITEVTEENPEGQTLQTSSAQAVSADGTIIAGYGSTKTSTKAFVTIFEGTEVDEEGNVSAILTSTILPTIAGGKYAEAYAMTVTPEVVDDNGVVVDPGVIYIAGRSDSPKGPQSCIWFEGDDPATTDIVEEWVVKGIGGLSKKKYDSVATGIVHRPGAADGDLMVVGSSKSILYPSEAFVWAGNPTLEEEEDPVGYMYDLEYILIKTGVGEASLMGSSWILNEATGVALYEDGTARIVGWGINPEGGVEAWVVTGYPEYELATLLTHDE